MGARNAEEKVIEEMVEQVDAEWAEQRMSQGKGKIWEVNPPKASHFGGVWERAIGSIRKVIDATLLNLKSRLLNKEEFDTMLTRAAAIVKSTPLWQSLDSPDEPQPLSPAMLSTKRDHPYPIPKGVFDERNMLDYGPSRWKRIEAAAEMF